MIEINNKATYMDAIRSLAPSSAFKLEKDGKTFVYFRNKDGLIQPTESEIDAEVIRLQAEYDAQEYARKREAEYPSVQELVVALYDTDDKSAIEAKRAAVKAKYPKP
jgi:hypothetical protein